MIRDVTHALENFDFEKAIRELRRIGKCVKKKKINQWNKSKAVIAQIKTFL